MAVEIRPSVVSTYPGGRIVFEVYDNNVRWNLATMEDAGIRVEFPDATAAPGIIQADGSFVVTVPDIRGVFEDTTMVITWDDTSDVGYATVTVAGVGAAPVQITTHPLLNLVGQVTAQVHDPTGLVVATVPMTADESGNYSAMITPTDQWKDGEYTIVISDAERQKDVMYQTFVKPQLASAPTFWSLPDWAQVWLQYLKYDWLGDTAPVPPAAWMTIEQYAKHWVMTTMELNQIPPYTDVAPTGAPMEWSQTLVKGAAIKAFDYLANRGVAVPRFTGSPIVMQDESHLQSSWEQRRATIVDEYRKECIRLKGHYLPRPKITVDPMLGWIGGSISGTARLSLLGRPSWFVRAWSGR